MPKIQQSVSLPPELWAQIDELIGYFGASRGEVITHALNVWFRSHGSEIESERRRIDTLRPQIDRFLQEHSSQRIRKRREDSTRNDSTLKERLE